MDMKILSGIVFFLLCSPILLVFFFMIKKSRTTDEKEHAINKSVLDVIPIAYYDTSVDAYKMKNGEYMDFFKINTKDIYSLSENERILYDLTFTKLYRTYPDDLKFITLNFPTNTRKQQEYWKHKIELTTNPFLKKQQEEKLFQLEWLQRNSTKREFYLCYYAANKDALKKASSDILAIMGTGRDGLLELLSPTKKHSILFKIANKCSQIFTTETR